VSKIDDLKKKIETLRAEKNRIEKEILVHQSNRDRDLKKLQDDFQITEEQIEEKEKELKASLEEKLTKFKEVSDKIEAGINSVKQILNN
jgi:predicted  nucleic acid-binding Zn-ribbon protein